MQSVATQAGTAILRRGGNAAEAAVAMGAVLAAVMPHFRNLGGDAVWLMADCVPHLLHGSQGADGQPQTLAVLLTALIYQGPDPAETLAQPRFLLGRTFSDARA